MGLKYALSILIVSLLFFAGSIQDVNALSCKQVVDPKERLETYGGAVYGEVVRIKGDIKQQGIVGPKEYVKYILLDVERSWNTAVPSQIIVATDYTWGFPYEEGKSYFLYVGHTDGEYLNSPCSPVMELPSVNQVDKQIGEGQAPIKEVHVGYKMWLMTDKDYDVAILACMLIAALSTTGFYLFRRRRKRKLL